MRATIMACIRVESWLIAGVSQMPPRSTTSIVTRNRHSVPSEGDEGIYMGIPHNAHAAAGLVG